MAQSLISLYETDYYAWALQNAELMKQGRFEDLDTAHLIEEIESMGASEKRALENSLIELMLHLLKWQFQKKRRGSNWEISIHKQRIAVEKILHDNPSLKYQLHERILECYVYASRYVVAETKLLLTKFPTECPYSMEQLADTEYMPD